MNGAPLGADGHADQPLISVVIASVNGLPGIAECLEALTSQEGGISAEILVMDCCGDETRELIRRRFPEPPVYLIPVEGRPSIPALRALGISRARGRMIAITEDHCIADRQWFRTIERAHRAGHLAVGGPVENGSIERTVDWAVFFCEYVRFMRPLPRGIVYEIPGNNSAYDRSVFERLGPEFQAEVWESFLHSRMREQGVQFYCDPEMIVSHKKEFGYAYFLSQRYHYSRSFAGMRLAGARWWKRLAYACATPLLPGLLLARMVKTLAAKRRHWGRFLVALPVIATFLVSWAWGEAVGALLGPGRSLERVE